MVGKSLKPSTRYLKECCLDGTTSVSLTQTVSGKEAWGRSNVITIYRIQVREMTGHITAELMNIRKLSQASS